MVVFPVGGSVSSENKRVRLSVVKHTIMVSEINIQPSINRAQRHLGMNSAWMELEQFGG